MNVLNKLNMAYNKLIRSYEKNLFPWIYHGKTQINYKFKVYKSIGKTYRRELTNGQSCSRRGLLPKQKGVVYNKIYKSKSMET